MLLQNAGLQYGEGLEVEAENGEGNDDEEQGEEEDGAEGEEEDTEDAANYMDEADQQKMQLLYQ